MTTPIRRGGHKVTWALRDSVLTSARPAPSWHSDEGIGSGSGASSQGSDIYFTPGRFVELSPLPMGSVTPKRKYDPTSLHYAENVQSAPAELGHVHQKIAMRAPSARHSTDHHLLIPMVRDEPVSDEFELDPMAPVRARRSRGGDSPLEVVVEEADRSNDDVTSEKDAGQAQSSIRNREKRDDWGESFKIQWLSTQKVSFQKTRHLRNPWNHNREVKVSRDGTELEPSIGRRLIMEWASLASK